MGNRSSSEFPGNLRIPDADLIEHFQILQGCLRSLPASATEPIRSISSEDSAAMIKSKFLRLSSTELFPDLSGFQLEVLSGLCLDAHRSEEFFLTTDKNQWLSTTIKSCKASVASSMRLFSLTICTNVISKTIIHSNVLPCGPYWTDWASENVRRFPCSIVNEASQQNKTLKMKVHEWNDRKEECSIGRPHEPERPEDGTKKPVQKVLWEISTDDVESVHRRGEGGQGSIWLVAWRRGKFIRKDYLMTLNEFRTEADVIDKLCHPNIVYIFGISFDEPSLSLYMECMETDLLSVILDISRHEGRTIGPPFSYHDSVDILLQIAKAMAHMHENNVIHGDLKSANILISRLKISEDRYHYLAKVADFGSAKVKDSEPFKPSAGTTYYAAPEVLRSRKCTLDSAEVPEKTDVYSYGLIAFELLTGKDMKYVYKQIHKLDFPDQKMKEGVIKGELLPPLRAEWQFGSNLKLISHIENCWIENSQRPSFSELVQVLICETPQPRV